MKNLLSKVVVLSNENLFLLLLSIFITIDSIVYREYGELHEASFVIICVNIVYPVLYTVKKLLYSFKKSNHWTDMVTLSNFLFIISGIASIHCRYTTYVPQKEDMTLYASLSNGTLVNGVLVGEQVVDERLSINKILADEQLINDLFESENSRIEGIDTGLQVSISKQPEHMSKTIIFKAISRATIFKTLYLQMAMACILRAFQRLTYYSMKRDGLRGVLGPLFVVFVMLVVFMISGHENNERARQESVMLGYVICGLILTVCSLLGFTVEESFEEPKNIDVTAVMFQSFLLLLALYVAQFWEIPQGVIRLVID